MKMPEPIIEPATIIVESKSPRLRCKWRCTAVPGVGSICCPTVLLSLAGPNLYLRAPAVVKLQQVGQFNSKLSLPGNKCGSKLIELRRVFRVDLVFAFRENMQQRSANPFTNDSRMECGHERVLFPVQYQGRALYLFQLRAVDFPTRRVEFFQPHDITFPQA